MSAMTRCGAWPLIICLTLLGAGCGFHLRGSFDVPEEMDPTYIQTHPGNPMGRALREALQSSNVALVDEAKEASAVIRILKEDQHRRVGAVDSRGKVVEFALSYRVDFDLRDAQGKELVPRQTINLVRNQVNSDVEVLGKQEEQDLFFRDMRREMADRILGRLSRQLR